MALTVSLDLASTVTRSHSLTPAVSSGARSSLGAALTTVAGSDDGYDWKESTLATLRARQSTALAGESSGAGRAMGTALENSVAAEANAVLVRNQILSDVTTAVRTHTSVPPLPLELLR